MIPHPPRTLLLRLFFLRQVFLRLVVPSLGATIGFLFAVRFGWIQHWNVNVLASFAGVVWLTGYLSDRRLRGVFRRWHRSPRPALILATGAIVWAWLAQGREAQNGRVWLLALLGVALGTVAQIVFVSQVRRVRASVVEAFRWLALALVCAWVIHPYATRPLVGGGDAHHYAQQLADAAAQFRQGEHQLFVGQSAFAFNGDIHPLRTAPYFSYLGGAMSLLAGPAFPTTAVQNALIVLSLGSAAALLYLLLSRLRPRAAWLAFWLTAAFAACPGVLALIYSGDMIGSWLTLPLLPLVLYATIRFWEDNPTVGTLCLLAASIALLWLAHPPVAFWTSALVALPLAARVFVRWDGGRRFWFAAATVAACGLLCGYVFVSVDTLQLPTDPNLVKFVREGGIAEILRTGWAGIWRPMELTGSDLIRNLQLSPAIWLAAAIGLASVRRTRWLGGTLLVGMLAMLLLLYPSPLANRLWAGMPAAVISATDKWPMQRFYLILSVAIPFLAVLAWPARSARRRTTFLTTALFTGLAATTLFSLYDARKLLARGRAVTSSPEMTERRMRPENVVLSRYSHEYYGRLPRVFTHGTVSPGMHNRLLERDTLNPVDINLLALQPASLQGAVESRTRHRFQGTDYGGTYFPALRLEPGRSYFVRFLFEPDPPEGTLQLLGRSIYREYTLPMSGEAQAFGSTRTSREGFSLWTTASVPEEVEMRFYGLPGKRNFQNLGEVELIAFNRAALPLHLQSLHPFRVSVTNAAPAWLETPKLFLPGYKAAIDGNAAPVERSPDGLVMIPVPAGQHLVDLTYTGPIGLRIAYWGTAAAWVLFFAFLLWHARKPQVTTGIFFQFGRVAGFAVLIGLTAAAADQVNTQLHPTLSPVSLSERPLDVTFRLPVGLERKREELWSFDHENSRWRLHCFYQDGQTVRLGLVNESGLVAESEAIQINYLLDHRLIITVVPASEFAPTQLRLWINHRLVTFPLVNNSSARAIQVEPFTGKLLGITPSRGPAL